MRDASMLQLVVELGGAMLFAIGAAFTVYWNLLGKKYRPLTTQKKIAVKQKVARAGSQVLQPVMQLNRAGYQQ